MAYRDNRAHPVRMYGKGPFAGTGILPYTKPRIAVSGTCTPAALESEVVAGGETIILTISNGKWAESGAVFNAARQAIIDGLDSDQAEAAGWDAVVKAEEVVGAVVRTSDTVVTITLSEFDGDPKTAYVTTITETITPTVPAAAMAGQRGAIVASTFSITTGS